MHVSRACNPYQPVTGQTYGRDVFTKVILALSLAGLGCYSAAASPRSEPSCRDAALVSVKTYKVLLRFSARNGITPLRKPLLPGLNAVADGHGGWYVAGMGLGHLRHGGRLDRSWHAALRRKLAVRTLQRVGDQLYVSDRRRVFAIDARTGRTRWASPTVRRGPGRILALAANGTTVYAGGQFGGVAGRSRAGLAAFDVRTGRLLPWRPPLRRNSEVTALALKPRLLYLGGLFATVGGKPRFGVAAVRLDTRAVTAFAPKLVGGNGVNAIAPAGRIVLIGAPGDGGAYNSRTGERLRGYDSVFNANAIEVRGQTAYLGGTIRDSIPLYNLLAINLRTGERRVWFPRVAGSVQVERIAVSGEKLFVGGEFCSSLG